MVQGAGLGIFIDWHHIAQQEVEISWPIVRSSPEAWSRYLHYVRAQLTELLASYGTIDLLWFDGEWGSAVQRSGTPTGCMR